MFYSEDLLWVPQNSQLPSYLYNCSCSFIPTLLSAPSKESVSLSPYVAFQGRGVGEAGGGMESRVFVLPPPQRLQFHLSIRAFILQAALCDLVPVI